LRDFTGTTCSGQCKYQRSMHADLLACHHGVIRVFPKLDRATRVGRWALMKKAQTQKRQRSSVRSRRIGESSAGGEAAMIDKIFYLLALVLAFGLSCCAPDGGVVDEGQYAAKIVGDWQGTVADDNETISFNGNGRFMCRVRPRGFISNTLGQGVTGTIRGTWTIKGNVITLNIDSAEDANVVNKSTTSTIEMFKQNELLVRSSRGQTSKFMRM
jgi:hypothetical protein